MDFEKISYTILASIGGFIAYAISRQETSKKFVLKDAVVQSAGSGFVGLLVAMLCIAMGVEPLWIGPISGLFGWLGATATIQILKRFVYDKLSIQEDSEK